MLSDREMMLECYKTERVAMKIANQRREMQGESSAYGEGAFLALARRIESLLEKPEGDQA